MKKIKLSENQLFNIVKKIIKEQGGFDDVNTMVLHNVKVFNEIGEILDKLIFVIEQGHDAIEQNLPKDRILNGINKISKFLNVLKPDLNELYNNVYSDEYLKHALKEMGKTIDKSEKELSSLSHQQIGFHHPKFFKKSFAAGIGHEIGDEQLKNELIRIFDNIHRDALTLSEILADSGERNQQRAENLN